MKAIQDFGQLRCRQKVFVGDEFEPSLRNCKVFMEAVVLRNRPSQWHSRFPGGYVLLSIGKGEKEYRGYFNLADQAINGKARYIFTATKEAEEFYLVKSAKEQEEKQKAVEAVRVLIAEGMVILADALCVISAMQPLPEKISAHEIALVDNSGKLRATMKLDPSDGSAVAVYDADGHPSAVMTTSAPGLSVIDAYGADGRSHASMVAALSGGSEIGLSDGLGEPRLGKNVSPSGDPVVKLSDTQGFILGLGSITPNTGASTTHSAASIIMFGKDKHHHVIWSAP